MKDHPMFAMRDHPEPILDVTRRKTPAYRSWEAMRTRCLNPARHDYARYGGDGVKVCERWNSFKNFLADMGPRPIGTSLDRYPNASGNYEPGNCRWATITEQIRNRRVTRILDFHGETRPMAEWAEILGIKYRTLQNRVCNWNWTVERAFSTPVKNRDDAKVLP